MDILSVNDVPKELWKHRDGRITPEARAFHLTPAPKIVIVARKGPLNIGVSAIGLRDGAWIYGITIVHRDFRNNGVGSRLLKYRMIFQKSFRSEISNLPSIVAEDNKPSVRMCEKAGLMTHNKEIRVRRKDQKYVALIMGTENAAD